jgi:hypothetical protein
METRSLSVGIDTDFSNMIEQIGWVPVDAVGSGLRQLGSAGSAAEQAHAKCPGPAGAK